MVGTAVLIVEGFVEGSEVVEVVTGIVVVRTVVGPMVVGRGLVATNGGVGGGGGGGVMNGVVEDC